MILHPETRDRVSGDWHNGHTEQAELIGGINLPLTTAEADPQEIPTARQVRHAKNRKSVNPLSNRPLIDDNSGRNSLQPRHLPAAIDASRHFCVALAKILSRGLVGLRILLWGGRSVLEKHSNSEQTRQLLQRLDEGDLSALDDLLRLHRPYLIRLISARLTPDLAMRVDASDIVQEAQLEITKRIDDYLAQRPASFRVWARGQVLDRFIDQWRRHVQAGRRSIQREERVNDSSMAIARTLLTETPSKILQRQETVDRIRLLIEELSPIDREILTLRHAENLTGNEAAEVLGIDANTARQRFGRALRRLHQKLIEHGITPLGWQE